MIQKIITDKNFENLWLNKLTDGQRKARLEKAFKILERVRDKQFNLFKRIERDRIIDDPGPRLLYFEGTLKNIWDNVNFALSLGKSKNRKFSFYPARSVLENTFRLEHFTRQKSRGKQDDIAVKEFLRVCKRNYDFHKSQGNDNGTEEFRDLYKKFASLGNYPSIDRVKEKTLDPFPCIYDMVKNTKIRGGLSWYYHYQALAELTHGKLLHSQMMNMNEKSQHIRSLMYTLVMCNEVVKISDFHLGGATKKEVTEAIREAEYIVKKPINAIN